MSDELEDKILDILLERMVEDPGKCCEEIHQAYTEAGYILPGSTLYKMPKGKDLAREMAGLKQVIDDGVNTIELPVMMSGEEWYTRFQTALHENKDSTSIQGGWITINLVDEAASKASGLK